MHLAEAGRRGLTMIPFFMGTNPTALWCRAPVEGNQIYPILALQTPTLSRLLYPVREGTFLIGREDWVGRVIQKKGPLVMVEP